jgi:putative membrane protein
MDGPIEGEPHAALSDYLAAERTVLAWIRTGLALMGFGFVVARFGLFLQELQAVPNASSARAYGLSLWFGTALIAVGVFVNLFAGWQHARLVRLLDRGGPVRSRPAGPAVTIAVFLALVGLAMTIYLVSVRGSARAPTGNNSLNNEETPVTSSEGIRSA